MLLWRLFWEKSTYKSSTFCWNFLWNGVDDTIQNILDDDGDSIEELIKRQKDEIIERFQKASKWVEESGIVDDPKRLKFRMESTE